MNPPIIEIPSLQTLRQRYAYSFLTMVFWAFWIYLWLPVVSLLAWGIGFDFFYQRMIAQRGVQTIISLAGWYVLVVLFTVIAYSAWAGYNLFRFGKKERRKAVKVVEISELANWYEIDLKQLRKFQQIKHLVIHHDEHGKIDSIERQKPSTPIVRIA